MVFLDVQDWLLLGRFAKNLKNDFWGIKIKFSIESIVDNQILFFAWPGLLLIACFLCAIIAAAAFLNTSKLLKKAVLCSYAINIVFFLVTIIYPIYSWAFVNRMNVYGFYPLQPLGPIAFMSWFTCSISLICLFILVKLFRNVYKLERGLMPGDVVAPPAYGTKFLWFSICCVNIFENRFGAFFIINFVFSISKNRPRGETDSRVNPERPSPPPSY